MLRLYLRLIFATYFVMNIKAQCFAVSFQNSTAKHCAFNTAKHCVKAKSTIF